MDKTTAISPKALLTFVTLVILLSAAAEAWIATGGPDWLYLVLMWLPALSAVAAGIISMGERKERLSLKRLLLFLGLRKCRLSYVLLGIAFPFLYLLIPYLIYWLVYPENFAYTGVALPIILKDILPLLLLGVFINILSALGEELGWRGFLLPALTERRGRNKALLITGLFWALWHLPLLIAGDYMSGTPLWYKLPAFILCILPIGVIAGLLTYRSGSVWPAAFLHAAHNNFDQAVFGLITKGADKMLYVSETGFLTIICAWVLAGLAFAAFRKSADG